MSNDYYDLKSVLDKIIEKNGWTESVYQERIKRDWKEFVGEIASKNIKIKKLKDKILFLSGSASVWNSELLLRKEELINTINTKYGKKLLNNIIIK